VYFSDCHVTLHVTTVTFIGVSVAENFRYDIHQLTAIVAYVLGQQKPTGIK